jgi:hypothetical protein
MLHLHQQAAERAYLDKNKLRCKEVDGNGQPLFGMIYSDGMTTMSGNTPREGRKHHSVSGSFITSRVIGVEVYCVSSGSDIMVEVQRQGYSSYY